jgi:hypothetical protein
MSNKFKINTVSVSIVAVSFYFFFMATKHDPMLSKIIPFAFDPYDAIGSFGVIISAVLLTVAIIRTFRPYRNGLPTTGQKIFLARTQMAVSVAVLITTIADLITMVRHLSMWLGQIGGNELLLLVVGMAVLAAILGFLIRSSVRGFLPTNSCKWQRAVMVSLATIAILALYPEAVIQSSVGELCMLAAGMVLLFAPLSALIVALLPGNPEVVRRDMAGGWFSKAWVRWFTVVLPGIAIGTLLLIGESSEGKGGIPLPVRLMVSSIFIGAGTVGLVIAYAFLGKPLGLA